MNVGLNYENCFNYWNYWTGWILSCRVSLEKGYSVHGIIRSNSAGGLADRIKHLEDNPNVHLHYGDLSDFSKLIALTNSTR